MQNIEFSIPSSNGRDQLYGCVYVPEGEPRACVNLVHGFMSHQGEFAPVIEYLRDAGYVVYAIDLPGHGRTAAQNDAWGDYGDFGYETLLKDVEAVTVKIREERPDLPFFYYGFSMGTEIVRAVVARNAKNVKGVILEGLVESAMDVIALLDDEDLANAVEEAGDTVGWSWLGRAFAHCTERYVGLPNPDDFGTTIEGAGEQRAADPYRVEGHGVTIRGIRDFVQLYETVKDDVWVKAVPDDVAFFILSGDQDPCGNYGEGVYHLTNSLIESGHRQTMAHVCTGYRHQVATEPGPGLTLRSEFVDFIEAVIGGKDVRSIKIPH